MIFKRCFFVFLFFVLMMMSRTCFAQVNHLMFEMITVKEGLPANKVNCIAKDSLGFFWYGTTLGLVRHDGISYDVFQHDPNDDNSIPSDDIRSITVDKDNIVIVTTSGGHLFLYNYDNFGPNQIMRLDIRSNNGDLFFNGVVVDNGKNHLYSWNETGQLCRINKYSGQYIFVDDKSSISKQTIMLDPITTQKAGNNIYIGATNGFFRFNIDSQCIEWLDMRHLDILNSDEPSIGTIATFDLENIILGSAKLRSGSFKGLVLYNHKNNTFDKISANILGKFDLNDILIQSIYRCYESTYLFLPYGKSPVYFNFNTCEADTIPIFVDHLKRLNTISISCFHKEPDGELLIGSNQGIYIHEPFSYVFEEVFPYIKQQKYPNGLASSYYDKDRHQLLIAAPKVIRIYDYQKDTVLHEISMPQIQPHHRKRQEPELIPISKDEILVIASNIYVLDLVSKELSSIETNEENCLKEPYIKSNYFPYIQMGNVIYFIRDGVFHKLNLTNFFIDSISICDDTSTEVYIDASGMSVDTNNNIWISSYNHGLIEFNSSRFTFHKDDNKFFDINDIHIDDDNTIWLASKDFGVLAYEIKTTGLTQKLMFTIASGLNTNTVKQISEDGFNKLWVQTHYGISSIDKSNYHISNFAKQHGINFPHNMFRGKSKDVDGNIYLSEGIGIVKIRPNKFVAAYKAPDVFVKKFSIHNEPVMSFWKDTSIQLTWKKNNFSMEISAVNHTHAHMNSYKYMLENYHEQWVTINKNNLTPTFNNLAPGKYVFRAVAANHVGIWNKKGINIEIIISPPYWKTWWFTILFLGMLAYSIYWYIRFRVKQLRKQELLLIEKEIVTQAEERKRIAKDLHDDIGAQLSTLKMYIDILNRDISQQKDVTQFSKETQQLIGRTIDDMRHIITELSPQALELYGYFAAVKELIYRIRKVSDIHIVLDLDTSLSFSKSQETALFRVTQELFNNTLKHANATEIHFAIQMKTDGIVLDYSDNGKGFDMYNTTSGRGLYNINSRVKMLHGKVHQDSKIGSGTKYQIIF